MPAYISGLSFDFWIAMAVCETSLSTMYFFTEGFPVHVQIWHPAVKMRFYCLYTVAPLMRFSSAVSLIPFSSLCSREHPGLDRNSAPCVFYYIFFYWSPDIAVILLQEEHFGFCFDMEFCVLHIFLVFLSHSRNNFLFTIIHILIDIFYFRL